MEGADTARRAQPRGARSRAPSISRPTRSVGMLGLCCLLAGAHGLVIPTSPVATALAQPAALASSPVAVGASALLADLPDSSDTVVQFAIGAFILIAPTIGIRSALDAITLAKQDDDDRFDTPKQRAAREAKARAAAIKKQGRNRR